MAKSRTEYKLLQRLHKRLIVFVIFVIISLSIFILRLFQLKVIEGEKYYINLNGYVFHKPIPQNISLEISSDSINKTASRSCISGLPVQCKRGQSALFYVKKQNRLRKIIVSNVSSVHPKLNPGTTCIQAPAFALLYP